jgi:hypothetical protein
MRTGNARAAIGEFPELPSVSPPDFILQARELRWAGVLRVFQAFNFTMR